MRSFSHIAKAEKDGLLARKAILQRRVFFRMSMVGICGNILIGVWNLFAQDSVITVLIVLQIIIIVWLAITSVKRHRNPLKILKDPRCGFVLASRELMNMLGWLDQVVARVQSRTTTLTLAEAQRQQLQTALQQLDGSLAKTSLGQNRPNDAEINAAVSSLERLLEEAQSFNPQLILQAYLADSSRQETPMA